MPAIYECLEANGGAEGEAYAGGLNESTRCLVSRDGGLVLSSTFLAPGEWRCRAVNYR